MQEDPDIEQLPPGARRLIQSLDLPSGELLRFYRGRSMLGTFQPGDYLHIQQVALPDVQVGDVVAFRKPTDDDDPEVIVHRVLAIRPEGLVTLGDNNPMVDSTPVTAEMLVGRVTHFERGGQVYPTPTERQRPSGPLWLRRLRFGLKKTFFTLATPLYRLLRRSGLVASFWQPPLIVLRLENEQGSLLKYIYRGRTIASYSLETGECVYRRQPYDLAVPRR